MSRKYKGKYYSPKRRAIYAKGDDIDPIVLFDKCGWVCFVCHEKIDRWRRCPDLGAATIEHIKPLSKGGQHVWENVATSHLGCNQRRGDAEIGLLMSSGL